MLEETRNVLEDRKRYIEQIIELILVTVLNWVYRTSQLGSEIGPQWRYPPLVPQNANHPFCSPIVGENQSPAFLKSASHHHAGLDVCSAGVQILLQAADPPSSFSMLGLRPWIFFASAAKLEIKAHPVRNAYTPSRKISGLQKLTKEHATSKKGPESPFSLWDRVTQDSRFLSGLVSVQIYIWLYPRYSWFTSHMLTWQGMGKPRGSSDATAKIVGPAHSL